MLRKTGLVAMLLIATPPALGQDAGKTADEEAQAPVLPAQQPLSVTQPGQTAEAGGGRVGERQIRERTKGIKPMARIDNRVRNRVQTRLRNRIDRNYDPVADAASPFAAAEEETERAARR